MDGLFTIGRADLEKVFEVLRDRLESEALRGRGVPDWPFYDGMAQALGQPGLDAHYEYFRQKVEDGSWE